MKATFPPEVERARYRAVGRWYSAPGDDYGVFFFKRGAVKLKVIASSGSPEVPWDHVSVSTEHRCPTWDEMCWIKDLFFDEDELAVQYHPPKADYVNVHPHVLHIWRPHNAAVPMPPKVAV